MTTNPPAFPLAPRDLYGEVQPGMTLRDWFAGQIAVAFVAEIAKERTMAMKRQAAEVAEAAYQLADAMLEEREK